MGDEMVDTREAARVAAVQWANDAATVTELVHEGFNGDGPYGGHAFQCDRGVVIVGADGSRAWTLEPGTAEGRTAIVDDFWEAARHRGRSIDPRALTPLHRAAIGALVGGHASVADLASSAPTEGRRDPRPGRDPQPGRGQPVTDEPLRPDEIAQADYLLVFLSRHAKAPTQEGALRALAANDWLLAPPADHQRAHACPICGRPALGGPRYVTAVCDRCSPQTTCSHGHQITGTNTSLSGGFEARHTGDQSVCDQATADHRCWIGDRECRIAEAYMGGVVVTALPV